MNWRRQKGSTTSALGLLSSFDSAAMVLVKQVMGDRSCSAEVRAIQQRKSEVFPRLARVANNELKYLEKI